MVLAMIGPTQRTSLTPIRGRVGRGSAAGSTITVSLSTDPLSPLGGEPAVQATSRTGASTVTAGAALRLWPISRRITAPTISAAATTVMGVTCSPRTIAPRKTATTGLTNAYV